MAKSINSEESKLIFKGKPQYQPTSGEKDLETQERLYPYLAEASEGLVDVVNLAIKLQRPLLLEGEPGCGKTQLARAVAYEFSKRQKRKYPYKPWYVKSTDQARDGLYTYDAVLRLYDAQIASINSLEQSAKSRERLNEPTHEPYIKWGAIGEAFRASQKGERMIVLIDEIDKAETDFPNDLLLELEEKRFFVKETGEEIRANPDFSPIIFITSNAQKKLPDAFLRRCLYHFVQFPKPDKLMEILNARFGNTWSETLTRKALDRFLAIREAMEEDKGDFGKKISLSELIDWFTALHLHTPSSDLENLLKQRSLPYVSAVIKTREDLEDYAHIKPENEEDEEDAE